MQLENLIVLALIVWLAVLSGVLLMLYKSINKLTQGSGKSFSEVIGKIFEIQNKNSHNILSIEEEIKTINRGLLHIPKVSLVRFNPFKETGGDHSFVLGLLDKRFTGIVITVLHSRQNTRIYAKDIVNGKSDSDLSVEERKALDKAKSV